jgi:hypothetical protein
MNQALYAHMNNKRKMKKKKKRREWGRRRIMKGMKQTNIHCTHVWKYHTKTPCATIK